MNVQDLLKSALRKLTVIASGETPDDDMLSDGMETLNMLLHSWAVDGITLIGTVKESLPLVGGQAIYSWGVGGDFTTTPPSSIVSAAIKENDITYPQLDIIGPNSYRAIVDKTTQGQPDRLHFNPSRPLAYVYLFLIPSTAAMSLEIDSVKVLSAFTALTDTINIPLEQLLAVKRMLTIELAPEYGRQVSERQNKIAEDSFKAIMGQTCMVALMNDSPATDFSQEEQFDIGVID